MKKNLTPRIIILATLAGLTLIFLAAAAISLQNATKAHQNLQNMKMTRSFEAQQPTFTDVVLPVETAVSATATVAKIVVTEAVVIEVVVEETAVSPPTISPTNTSPPTPTLTPWQQVQQQVETLRNRLERGSEGHQGLSTALEESEPNETWCSNILIAIQDFNYVNDTASAEAIRELADAQNCEK